MWEENNILVIDNNDQRRHDAGVILHFLGENPMTFSPANGLSCWLLPAAGKYAAD